jgi:preprotein translocase subunit SecB
MKYEIVSKFIKDISFEIPSAESFVLLEKEISHYNLVFDINSKPFKKNIIEVNTILKLIAKEKLKNKINVEINVTALVLIKDNLSDKKLLEQVILIKVPTEIYPVLYDTFVYLFSKSGIKNIDIKKEVDFTKLYEERKK